MSRTKRLRALVVGVSLGLAMLAASTSAMADVWEVTVINDTGVPVNDIELTIFNPAGAEITGPIAVNPNPVIFTAPPPFNELDANWGGLPLNPGQPFIADFNLTTGIPPSLIGGTWTFGGVPVAPVNPVLTTFALVPEPSTMVLAGLAAAGLAVSSLRRRRNCNVETR